MKRSPIKRTAWNPKRKALPFRSAKKIAADRERAAVVARLREERLGCEGMALLRVAAHNASGRDQEAFIAALRSCNPWQRMLEPHEPLKRSRKSTGLADPERILMLCSPCHRFTESEVRLSTEAGLLIPSWRR